MFLQTNATLIGHWAPKMELASGNRNHKGKIHFNPCNIDLSQLTFSVKSNSHFHNPCLYWMIMEKPYSGIDETGSMSEEALDGKLIVKRLTL